VPSAPPGYTRFETSGAEVVAVEECAGAVRRAIGGTTLYAFAATHPERRELRGRAAAYAVPLPDGRTRVVVRHSRHGGLLAPVTGDRFLSPTRAPRELATSLRLAAARVPTPEVIAYAVYRAGGPLRRSDVATREVAGARDLATVLADRGSADPSSVLAAAADLLHALKRAGARHPDLNAANVLIVDDAGGPVRAVVLDVDRVVFEHPGDAKVAAANLRRLDRSLRKLRALGRIDLSDADLAALVAAASRG